MAFLFQSQPRPAGRRSAFTLLEIVVATAIFVVLAAGVLSATVMARRSANQAVIRNIAFDTAQGFLNQIKSGAKFGTLMDATTFPAGDPKRIITVTGVTLSPKNDNTTVETRVRLDAGAGDYLTPIAEDGSPVRIPLNSTSTADTQAVASMTSLPSFQLKLELNKLDDPGVNGASNAVLVTLRFRYKYSPSSSDSDYKTGAVSYISPRVSL